MDSMDDETVLMVISDHGFKSGSSRLKNRPEIWAGNAAKWHRLDGIIGFYGSGIKKGYEITGANLLDVAPTILVMQGLPLAADMPGKALTGVLEDDLAARINPNVVATLEKDRGPDESAPTASATASEETMKKLEALGYLTPDNANAHNNLGQRYQQRGEYLKAIEEYEKALALQPDFHAVYNNIAVCFGKLKRFEDAERALLRAIEIKPTDFFAMNNLAVTYINTGRLDDARKMAERIVSIEPGYVNGRITLGSVYAMTGQYEKAEKEFENALALEPDNKNAAENLRRVRQQKRGN
jgi:Flp pilus assembly protein TadD